MFVTIKVSIAAISRKVLYNRVGVDNCSRGNCLKEFSNQMF